MRRQATSPHLVLTRVSGALGRLRGMVWEPVSHGPILCERIDCGKELASWKEIRNRKGVRMRSGERWGKMFENAWFKLRLPRSLKTNGLYLTWKDQSEATLYIDGKPYYGFDVAHPYAELPARIKDISIHSICCQSAIWHPDLTEGRMLAAPGSLWQGPSLVRRNKAAWDALHDLTTLMELAEEEIKTAYPVLREPSSAVSIKLPFIELSSLGRRLLSSLDLAINIWDQEGLEAFGKSLQRILKAIPAEEFAIHAALTGHAHIDLVWLWPESIGEAKAVHSFSNVDYLMNRYPEFRFGYSQPASYEAVERLEPELMRRVHKHAKQKRWEILGGLYVESDTMLACGEALLRSFQLGQDWFVENTGKKSEVCWLPDCFGFSAALPQLMNGFGVRYFYTNKTVWRGTTPFPYTSFVWKGWDGSEVVAHVTCNYKNSYNGLATVSELMESERRHHESDVHPEVLVPIGYGDGGGGPTEAHLERARRIENLARVPRSQWTRIQDFFQRMEEVKEDLPVYHGEISVECHRGVATTHGYLKKAFRDTEVALQIWEAVRSLKGGSPIPEKFWKRLVFAQFHDFIPGSSVREVYQEGVPELESLTAEALKFSRKELGETRKSLPKAYFNSTLLPKTVWIKKGKQLTIPPLSISEESEAQVWKGEAVSGGTKRLSNGIVDVKFTSQGEISTLEIGGKKVSNSSSLNAMRVYEDKPAAFSSWDVDIAAFLSPVDLMRSPVLAAVVESSPHRIVVSFARQLTERSSVTIFYTLTAGSRLLDVCYKLDWNEKNRLLRASFPTRYLGRFARFGAAFGSVQRVQCGSSPADETFFEGAASRWAAVSDDGESEGLFIATEAKYGFACREGELTTTLVRSPEHTGEVGEAHSAVVPEGLRTSPAVPLHTDQGLHEIRLAIGFYDSGSPCEQLPAAVADTYFTDVVACQSRSMLGPIVGWSGNGSLVPVWSKPVGRGRWILRCHEVQGRRGTVQLLLKKGWSLFEASMNGSQKVKKLNPQKITFSPYQIMTVLVENKN